MNASPNDLLYRLLYESLETLNRCVFLEPT